MRPARSTRILPLLALTAAVLLAHFALLQAAPRTMSPQEPALARPFSTRAIETPPAALTPAAEPAPAPETASTAAAPAMAAAAPPSRRGARGVTPGRASSERPVQGSGDFSKFKRNTAKPHTESSHTAIYSVASTEPPALTSPVGAPLDATPAATTTITAPPATPAHSAHAAAFKVPASARLHYDVRAEARGLALDAQGELLWRHDDGAYEARLDLTLPLLGTRSQTSVGRITPEGLAPTRFSDKVRSELAAHFERAPGGVSGKIIFSANTPEAPLLAGAQDRLSVFLQLGAMLAGAPDQYPSGTTISLQIVGPRDADTWLFTVGDTEQLRLPIGELGAVKLTRNPRHEFDSKVEMWLAPSMGYLPVRIRLTQANGDRFDQRLRASDSP
ncbi:DUF3108 domain-containing protein [Rhodoferax sediminis]|uniref:DUF3108 domain-containing protein n=1 Tax=Rhodoferax sediminis TaxID=2509614 RepID=A0A515DFV8_9BURK|nr:DUF3108 domain-containing protein [Rhodoferax sediminis]QDL39269.1 DUF3108 domain-containing protein [Rhodoferax sediminis]